MPCVVCVSWFPCSSFCSRPVFLRRRRRRLLLLLLLVSSFPRSLFLLLLAFPCSFRQVHLTCLETCEFRDRVSSHHRRAAQSRRDLAGDPGPSSARTKRLPTVWVGRVGLGPLLGLVGPGGVGPDQRSEIRQIGGIPFLGGRVCLIIVVRVGDGRESRLAASFGPKGSCFLVGQVLQVMMVIIRSDDWIRWEPLCELGEVDQEEQE